MTLKQVAILFEFVCDKNNQQQIRQPCVDQWWTRSAHNFINGLQQNGAKPIDTSFIIDRLCDHCKSNFQKPLS